MKPQAAPPPNPLRRTEPGGDSWPWWVFALAFLLIVGVIVGVPLWFGHVINATGRGFGVGG